MQRGIEAEDRRPPGQRPARLGIGDEEGQHQAEADQATEIAEPPPGSRQPSKPSRGGQSRHHRVGHGDLEFRRRGGQREGRQDNQDRRRVRCRQPQAETAEQVDHGQRGDPGLEPAADIRDGAEDRSQDRDRGTGRRRGIAPQRLALGRRRRDQRGAIGPEHEGRDKRVERLLGEIEQDPGPAGAGRRPGITVHGHCRDGARPSRATTGSHHTST